MKHGISDQEWEDYLAGKSGPESRAWLDRHLNQCLDCRETYQRESAPMRLLGEAAAEAKARLTMRDERLFSMFSQIMEKVRGAESLADAYPADPQQIQSGLDLLQTVLCPVFGPKAAQNAMRLAANESSARSIDGITPESWKSFVGRLSAITSIVCGDIVAGLIREHAQL